MYIKSVILDGFKSYAERTVVDGFDRQFNAITGLNGSGKSNILDSICFVLGISNLSQVRATNLQELVYKNGQAGIIKATVSIVFDNTDPNQCPMGYDHFEEITVTRQVIIGGRNKYLINGCNAKNTQVQDLFRSVQLNVNNPHFLIMQGRITKVLNMKPPEIMSMIEEATGTKLYETKKENAQKILDKKEAKIRELQRVSKEEISPTLEKLKEEQSSYMEYQKILRELEYFSKLYVAYQYVSAQEQKLKSAKEIEESSSEVVKLRERKEKIIEEMALLDEKIVELEKKRDEEAGGVMTQLEEDLANVQKEDAKVQSSVTNIKDSMKTEQKKLTQLKKSYTSDENTVKSKQKEIDNFADSMKAIQEEREEAEKNYAKSQEHFHAISAGLSTNQDGQAASLKDQLMQAKKEVSDRETEKKQATMNLKHYQQEVKRKTSELKKTEDSYKKDQSAHNSLKSSIQKLKNEMDKLGYQDGKEEELDAERRQLSQHAYQLSSKVDAAEARFPNLRFEYKDPEKNWDRRKVFGLVANLITVKDTKYATALETAAGGKLYNVVVDTEETGKKLVMKGDLKRRYTIIPLNKISARPIDKSVINKAKQLVGANNVASALSLVDYDPALQRAMEFVFGNTLVCEDMDTAKKVTFDPSVNKRSVSVEGDLFDPAGLLTGGARAQTSSVLSNLGELNKIRKDLKNSEEQCRAIETEIQQISRTAEKYRGLKQQYELKTHEASVLEERLKQSNHHQQLEELEELKNSIADSEKILSEFEGKTKVAKSRISELEDKMKNEKAYREREMKNAEKQLKDAKKLLEEASKKAKTKEQEVDALRLEVESLEKDLASCQEEQDAVKEALQSYEEKLQAQSLAAEESKAKVKEMQDKVHQQKELLKACNKDINLHVSERQKLHKEDNNNQLKTQELEHSLTKLKQSGKDAETHVNYLLERYSWIVDEQKHFGTENSAYDFKANNMKEVHKKKEKLEDQKNKLAKTVNTRVMTMLTQAEEQHNSLLLKQGKVEQDRNKIASMMDDMDDKRSSALKKAYLKVTKDFGSIFSSLLPNTQAKLVPPEGKTILDGLEVKIAFGGVWKESLNELSGGQRSLVALSLILAMLRFKPAPLYILDEVDAALDTSHTQNVGMMLKKHFTDSQFVIVSLKDGMFNNANVLFKTAFIDGISTVTRYNHLAKRPVIQTNKKKRPHKELEGEENN